MNQSELESRLVLVLPLIGGEIGVFNQSQRVEKPKFQIKAKITFGTQFKRALNISICEI